MADSFDTYERWAVTKRTRSWIQMAKICFIHGTAGLCLRDPEGAQSRAAPLSKKEPADLILGI